MLNESKIQESKTPQNGKDYNAVLNPYNTRTYEETGWDQFVSSLGFRSAYDRAEAERLANYNLWESQHAEQQRQEMYNSAQEVKQREEEAGLNPALSGQTIGGGSSDALSFAPNVATSPEATDINSVTSTITSLANGAAGAVQTALNFVSSYQQIRGIKLDNDNKDAQLVESLVDLSNSILDNMQTTEENIDGIGEVSYPEIYKFASRIFSGRQKKRFEDIFKHTARGNKNRKRVADQINSTAPAVLSAVGNQQFLNGTQLDLNSSSFRPLREFTIDITDTLFELSKKTYEDIPKLQYESDKSRLEYEKSQYDAGKQHQNIDKSVFSAMENLTSKLEYYSTHGTELEKVVSLGLLFGMSLQMSNMLPHVSLSGGEYSDRYGTYRNKSTSIGF